LRAEGAGAYRGCVARVARALRRAGHASLSASGAAPRRDAGAAAALRAAIAAAAFPHARGARLRRQPPNSRSS
jgi:hypothetical protein